eukprot:30836-Pelagococcus_subviridis.AAC.7
MVPRADPKRDNKPTHPFAPRLTDARRPPPAATRSSGTGATTTAPSPERSPRSRSGVDKS